MTSRAELTPQPEATLIIGHWSSTCSACGRGALLTEYAHTTALGYFPADMPDDDPARKGCGAVFIEVVAEYGPAEKAEIQAIRPDLPYADGSL